MLTARASAALLPGVEVGEQGRRARSAQDAVARRRRGLVVLVANVADELLEQILERHEPERALCSSCTIARCGCARSMRNSSSLQACAERATPRAAAWRPLSAALEHVERVNHADDVVERPSIDGTRL